MEQKKHHSDLNSNISHTKSVSSNTKGTTTTSIFSDEEIKFGDNSLWIFSNDNKFRLLTQKIVGHKGQGVTETVYTHFELAELKDAINKI